MIACMQMLRSCKVKPGVSLKKHEYHLFDAGSPVGSVSLVTVPTHRSGVGMPPISWCGVCLRCSSELDAATEMLTVAFTPAVSLRSFKSSKTRTAPYRSHVACATKFRAGDVSLWTCFRSAACSVLFTRLKDPGLTGVTESGGQRE